MLTVLDLDLDFFVWPVVRGPVEGRPSDSDLACASPEQVRLFLEEQCGLSRESSPVFVDTLGRTIVPLGSVSNNPATYTVGGLNYTVSYTTSSANFTAPSQTIGPFASQSGQYCTTNFTVPNTSTANGTKLDDGISKVIDSITLPSGQKYNFQYQNSFGLVSRIDYPDGAWVTYDWDYSDDPSEYVGFSGNNGGGGLCNFIYKTPVIKTRTVGFTPGTTAQTQTFTYHTNWSATNYNAWDSKSTTMTAVDNITGRKSQIVYTYDGVAGSAGYPDGYTGEIAVETNVQYTDLGTTGAPSSKILKTVSKTWTNPFQLTSEKTVLDGTSTETIFCYQPGSDRVQEEDVYDYGVQSPAVTQVNYSSAQTPPSCGQMNPTRKTIYSYQRFTPNPVLPYDPAENYYVPVNPFVGFSLSGSARACSR